MPDSKPLLFSGLKSKRQLVLLFAFVAGLSAGHNQAQETVSSRLPSDSTPTKKAVGKPSEMESAASEQKGRAMGSAATEPGESEALDTNPLTAQPDAEQTSTTDNDMPEGIKEEQSRERHVHRLPFDLRRQARNNITAISGVTDDAILFGQSAALEGALAENGRNARLGIQAAFWEINTQGGVHGRDLRLITLDDGYEPERAIENVRFLIHDERVFAIAGAVGSSTSRASVPIAAASGVPFIAPFTGNVELRTDAWENVIHLRASYDEETESMINHLINDLMITRIAVMYQNDYFGRDGYAGARIALQRRNLEPVASGVYERNTSAIKTALLDIRKAEPEAVIIIGAYRAASKLILWSRATGFDPVFMAISFVGGQALANALGKKGAGVFVTQVVPFPTGDHLPITVSYLEAMADVAPLIEPGFVSFEGYLTGRLIVEALRASGRELTREIFLDSFKESPLIDLDGFELYYGEGIDQGSNSVFLTVINDAGRYQPIEKLTDVLQCARC